MNPQVKEMWVKALRSGKYYQGQGELVTMPKYPDRSPMHCCLGVLCDLAMKEGIVSLRPGNANTQGTWIRNFFGTEYEHNNGLARFETLPPSVVHWAGLEDANPTLDKVHNPEFADNTEEQEDKYLVLISELNDEYSYPFEILAKLIEEQL